MFYFFTFFFEPMFCHVNEGVKRDILQYFRR